MRETAERHIKREYENQSGGPQERKRPMPREMDVISHMKFQPIILYDELKFFNDFFRKGIFYKAVYKAVSNTQRPEAQKILLLPIASRSVISADYMLRQHGNLGRSHEPIDVTFPWGTSSCTHYQTVQIENNQRENSEIHDMLVCKLPETMDIVFGRDFLKDLSVRALSLDRKGRDKCMMTVDLYGPEERPDSFHIKGGFQLEDMSVLPWSMETTWGYFFSEGDTGPAAKIILSEAEQAASRPTSVNNVPRRSPIYLPDDASLSSSLRVRYRSY